MKAAQIDRFGGPEVFQIVDLPLPEAGPGQVLIRIAVCGVNYSETSLRRNAFIVTSPLPVVLGAEVAGTVEAVGPGVEAFKVGDRVAAAMFADGGRSGGYAEMAAVNAACVVPVPDNVGLEAAAAALTQGLTAYYMTRAISPAGKRVLINSAAGGVGVWLVQLCRLAGALQVVAAVGDEAKFEAVQALGAHGAVNYRSAGWAETVKRLLEGSGPDIIYEGTGGDVIAEGLALLAPRGEYVVYSTRTVKDFAFGPREVARLSMNNQSLTGFSIGSYLNPAGLRSGMAAIFQLLSKGDVRLTIAGRYALHEVADAHRALESRNTVGKVVLTISEK